MKEGPGDHTKNSYPITDRDIPIDWGAVPPGKRWNGWPRKGGSCPTWRDGVPEGRMCSGHNQAQQEEDKNQGEARRPGTSQDAVEGGGRE